MTDSLQLSFRSEGSPVRTATCSGAIELGRIDPSRAVPDVLFEPVASEGAVRVAIAEPRESDVSRRQVRLQRRSANAVAITNLSGTITIRCYGRRDVPPGTTVECPLPSSFQIGRVVVGVAAAEDAPTATPADQAPDLRSLETPTAFLPDPKPSASAPLRSITDLIPATAKSDIAGLVRWWQQVIGVLQSASNSGDFFHKAAQALVDLVGLHLGAVYLRDGNAWKPVAIASREDSRARPSTSVLGRVLQEKRTFWNKIDTNVDVLSSLSALEAYVAAPILAGDGQVLGALYGHREAVPTAGETAEITHLEALLVETFACGVAAGLARLEQQKTAVRQKVQFEQFFSPQLAAQLEAEPDLLRGRDADVTVLFCDLREFSAVSERLGPAQTMDWISGVLNPLSDEVAAQGGVLVDYVGDELLAMWGAPTAQPEHAALACRAAQRMVAALPAINERWEHVIGRPTKFGIGINSCTARVGNTGSSRKFKYGPLGNGVNLGSRVQGATKYLRVTTIVTGPTRKLLDESFRLRRLCTVQVVNIVEPVELFELDCAAGPAGGELFPRFEEALAAFEAGNFATASRLLGGLLDAFPGDGPSLVLLSRVVDAMINEPRQFSPVWRLPGK